MFGWEDLLKIVCLYKIFKSHYLTYKEIEKATLGLTGLYSLRVLIGENVWHLDVGLGDLLSAAGEKGGLFNL